MSNLVSVGVGRSHHGDEDRNDLHQHNPGDVHGRDHDDNDDTQVILFRRVSDDSNMKIKGT